MIVLQFITLLSCLLFTGAAIYISVAEHPARLECDTAIAVTVFVPSYKRASVMQAALALVATIGAVIVWAIGGVHLWLIGALFIFFVVPFTLLVIMPTNGKLQSPYLDKSAASTRQLLERWGRLHLVRSGASFIASCIFLSLVISG